MRYSGPANGRAVAMSMIRFPSGTGASCREDRRVRLKGERAARRWYKAKTRVAKHLMIRAEGAERSCLIDRIV